MVGVSGELLRPLTAGRGLTCRKTSCSLEGPFSPEQSTNSQDKSSKTGKRLRYAYRNWKTKSTLIYAIDGQRSNRLAGKPASRRIAGITLALVLLRKITKLIDFFSSARKKSNLVPLFWISKDGQTIQVSCFPNQTDTILASKTSIAKLLLRFSLTSERI